MTGQQMPTRIEIVYRDALENISFTKKQEWIVAGYGLTIHAAVVAIKHQFQPALCLQIVLTCAASLAALYGLAVFGCYAQGLAKWRRRLDWIYANHFEGAERAGLALGERPKYTEWVFIGGLCLTLLTSTIVSLGVLWS